MNEKIFYSHFYSISNVNIQVIARFIREFHISCERVEKEDKKLRKTTQKEEKRRELFKEEKKNIATS